MGRSHFWLSVSVLRRDRKVSVSFNLSGPDRVAHYHLVRERRDEIEAALGQTLEWRPERRTGQVCLTWPGEAVLEVEEGWPQQHHWLAETLEQFNQVFRPLVRDLDAADWIPDADIDDDDGEEATL